MGKRSSSRRVPGPYTQAKNKNASDRTSADWAVIRNHASEWRAANRESIRMKNNSYQKSYRLLNRDKINAAQRIKSKMDPGRFSSYQHIAKKRGLDFDLTLEEFSSLRAKACYYCGRTTPGGGGVDRMDNRFGYMPGNVLPCCGPCNRAKLDMTAAQFVEMCILVADRFRGDR